jgi:hypothetical protein
MNKLRCTSSEKEVKCRSMWGENEMGGQKQRITKDEKTKERSEMCCDYRYFSVSQGTYRQKSLFLYHVRPLNCD